MGRIFYLMGKSSSGKDTIFKKLLEDKTLSLYTIVLYTTRPIRAEETDGVEYHFIKDAEAEELKNSDKIIEMRAYDTCQGIWKYFTVDDGTINFDCYNYLMIGTLESYIKTRDYFGKEKVVPVLIELDDGERLARALIRERAQKNPKYSEMCRRFLADAEDFSEKKKREAGITKVFVNEELEQCLSEIREYIRSFGG